MLRKKRGQSTLEYITVFVAIVAAILIFAYVKMKPAVEKMMDSASGKVEDAATKFNTSDNTTPNAANTGVTVTPAPENGS